MSGTPTRSRPKIEVVRLPSCEQAKLRPLLEGGVQLQAQFQHMRYGDYASYSSLEDGSKQSFRFQDHDYMGRKTPLATKSLDNIFAKQLSSGAERGSPFLWRDVTRSEEQLYHTPKSFSGTTYLRNKVARFSGARSCITALLKKLSPRPHHKTGSPNNPCPWVVVEFSNQDLDSPNASGWTNSVTSDHSFDMAVQANKLQKQQTATRQATREEVQVAHEGFDNTIRQREVRQHRISRSGLAATKHRPAFNTGNRQVSGGTAAAKVKAKVAATLRPHTLRIELASHHQHSSSMASDESIGSCSLDADATASEASECVDLATVSARTLRSLQLSTKTPDPDSVALKSPGGASTPEYVKRTARLFESSEGTGVGSSQSPKSSVQRSNGKHAISSKTSEVPSVVVNGTNSVKTGENSVNSDSFTGKKPSYLGLACSISGYSGITTYDSKLREGFRSRDHSPGRLGIIKSRDVSPLRSSLDHTDNHLTPTFKSDCGNFLVTPPTRSGLGTVSSDTDISLKSGLIDSTTVGNASTGSTSGRHVGLMNHINGDNKIVTKEKEFSPESERTMGEEGKFSTSLHYTMNGNAESNQRHAGSSQYVESCSGSSKREFFSSTTSNIQESTRNFMSSMLTTDSSFTSTSYESSTIQTTIQSRDTTDASPVKNFPLTSVPRDGFGTASLIKSSPESPKTAPRDSPVSHMTSSTRDSSGLSSPFKRSPESPKASSKDSLSAPMASPMKRSPGAVRVVEFTSQTKSYVRTAFVSGSSMETPSYSSQGYSDSSQSKSYNIDGVQTSSYVRSVRSGPAVSGSPTSEKPESSSAQTNGMNSESSMWTSKSFIQQRVERLYGPGALAQGFFRRTRHKPPDEIQSASENLPSHNHRSNSSPSLPVLRHLRPEFRAQLSLGPTTRKLQERIVETSVAEEESADVSKRSSEIKPVQQQISVESLSESLTDLQPAAPDVVLPIDQSQSVSSQAPEPSVESDVVSKTQEKDGHYFLKLLKQEIDRLNGLVEAAEADLAGGETLPEEALGKLRAASGQARLLIRQKLQQFEGLCHKNIGQSSEEPFPTTSEDLAGFWDMVMLQVEHVNRLFDEITTLRAANWVEVKVPSKDVTDGVPKRRPASAVKRSSVKSSTGSEAARKAREEGRRKMMEERRKAMREKRDAASTSGQVEIFVPQENGLKRSDA
ncbi:uncharacterized protein [Periplaneta americana]|uniref:uncharacterized protein isoform X2 n=1 Tax=Periplaneta americana TaxID=6978 RepID=UPI0037E8C1DD